MPSNNESEMSPGEAVAAGLCAECRHPVNATTYRDHIAAHWTNLSNPEAALRAELMHSHYTGSPGVNR